MCLTRSGVGATSLIVVGSVLAVFAISTPARAQGYGVYEQGTCMMGRAGAGVAAPCNDGSAIFFNPAGLALDTSGVISVNITGIAPRGTFTNSTTGLVSTLNNRTIPVPAGYAAFPIGKHAIAGVGVFAPYGLISDWPNTAEGRFLGYYSSVKSIYIQPTVAARFGNLLVGGGIDITHTSVELKQRADLSTQRITGTPYTFGALGVPPGTDFADVDLTGSANSVGAHLGAIITASDQFSIGARYLFRQHATINNGQFAPTQISTNLTTPIPLPGVPAGTPIDLLLRPLFGSGGPLSSQTATTELPMPDQFVVGIAITPTEAFKLFVDYQRTNWSLFDTLTITPQIATQIVNVENYTSTNGVRIGAEFGLGGAILRAGFDGHGPAAPDETVTPLLPEASRKEFTAGVTVPAKGKVQVDFAYMYINQSDRAGRSTNGPNNGTYHYYGNLFSGGFSVHF